MIYDPAEDSYLLESVIEGYAKGKSVIDIGTGSGILAKKAKQSGAKSVTALDINPEAIKQLKKEKINGIKLIHSNLFQKVKGKFDLIICNPPYLPEEKEEDKQSKLATSGGKSGDEFIIKFLNQTLSHLNKNGIILILVSSLTPIKKINHLLKRLKLKNKVIASKKIFFEELFVWEIKHNNA